MLVVGLNSDEWLTRKKGRPFMSWSERASIISALECVDNVIEFDDADGTACHAIEQAVMRYPDDEIIFANGGDRQLGSTPEIEFAKDLKEIGNVSFMFGIGGHDKKNSSSWILKDWAQPTTQRAWGSYTVLHNGPGWAVKELAFGTETPLSDQRHFIRSEHWHVVEGTIRMDLEFDNGDKSSIVYTSGQSIDIPVLTWHKATNIGDCTAKVIEVWMGAELTEDDIERRD
jgi:mannose-6-phosphate isomerase-like protein (cupin superfamily)